MTRRSFGQVGSWRCSPWASGTSPARSQLRPEAHSSVEGRTSELRMEIFADRECEDPVPHPHFDPRACFRAWLRLSLAPSARTRAREGYRLRFGMAGSGSEDRACEHGRTVHSGGGLVLDLISPSILFDFGGPGERPSLSAGPLEAIALSRREICLYRPGGMRLAGEGRETLVQTLRVRCYEDGRSAGTGGSLWDVALILSEVLLDLYLSSRLRGKRVLELGAGTGVPSVVASLLGARVTITDMSEEALQVAKVNVGENLGRGCQWMLRTLRWGGEMSQVLEGSGAGAATGAEAGAVGISCCDDSFDLIIASECVYSEKSIGPLTRQ
eukprot:768679-Hanusia_phi.AAC.8